MVNEDAVSVVIGVVTRLNERQQEYPRGSGRQQWQVWIDLGQCVTLMALNVRASKFPSPGNMAAFQVAPSRSGKTPMIHKWGWPDASGKGALPDALNVEWVESVAGASTSDVVGVSRNGS